MCYAINVAPAEAARIAARAGRQLLLSIADLDYPDPPRWTTVFALPRIPIYRPAAQGGAALALWPFLPPRVRSKDEARILANQTGNCRSEEMFEKPTWREAAVARRCLVPVLGYFEHQHRFKASAKAPVKVPDWFHRPGGEIFWIAGLWQDWQGEPTVTLCTTAANRLNAWVHNSNPRQPLIVPDEHAARWLESGGPEPLAPLLSPRDDDGIVAQETEGSTGKRLEKAPPPPPGGPG
jgi:putative SOS response-associated peptidase YedK